MKNKPNDKTKDLAALLFDHYMMSCRQIAKYLHRHHKINVSHSTVYRWLNC